MRDEKDLLASIEADEWVSVPNLEEEKLKLINALRQRKKQKKISISISEEELQKLKEKSSKSGIPYNYIIKSLIKQYLEDRVKLEI